MAADLIPALSYTFLANLLHWPAGTVPVTTVQSSEEVYPVDKLPRTQRDSLARLVAKSIVGSQGLPVGVQVMTPMWKDEKCIEIMREIERGVNFQEKPASLR
jgi:Asp-tRNA(Asn)/Glu-tRNA(Gln) amidotransferase A subunit family amidase